MSNENIDLTPRWSRNIMDSLVGEFNNQPNRFFSRKDMGGFPDSTIIEELKRANEGMKPEPPSDNFPRRSKLWLLTSGEKSIYDSIQVVENMGADPRLTEAIILLQRARDMVADWVDNIPMKS